jgi:hypothetical protein
MRRTTIIAAAVATAAAALPAGALASTVTSDGTTITYADRGAAADVVSSNQPPGRFIDEGSAIVAQGACVAGPPVTCPGFAMVAALGGNDDTAKIASLGPVSIMGGSGDDGAYGWGATVRIDGGSGDDLGVADANGTAAVIGGGGDDRLFARGAGVVVDGNDGDDKVISDANGTATLSGGSGADQVVAFKHAAGGTLAGGRGSDVLAISGTPLIDVEGWTVDGGRGDDVIDASGDGDVPDTVTCGAGLDVVYADAQDSVAADCEEVVPAPAPADSEARAAVERATAFKAAVGTLHPDALTPGPLLPGL